MKNFLIMCIGISVFIQACAVNPPQGNGGENTKITVKETEEVKTLKVPKSAADCEKAGGVWGPVGLFPQPVCNIKTSDGGAVCTDSEQCEGSCLADLTSAEEDSVNAGNPLKKEGSCSEWSMVVGCLAFVEDGYVNNIMCLD